jgi:hypothetical protein
MVPSRIVELEASPGDRVTLSVHARTIEDHRTGEHLSIAGWVMAGVGLALEVGALAVNSNSQAQPILLWSGVGAAGATIGLAISSYVLLQPTGLGQSVMASVRAASGVDAWKRLPVWREPEAGQVRATNIPVFTTTF